MSSSPSSSLLKLYGVPLSQPTRAVLWTLLQERVKFDFVLTVPGSTNKIGTRHESYQSVSGGKTHKVPLLVIEEEQPNTTNITDDNVVVVFEGAAILTHLCERYGWDHWYALSGTAHKARLDSYLHWHHEETRAVARVVRPLLRADLKLTVTDEDRVVADRVLHKLDQAWLGDSNNSGQKFIVTHNRPSIADVLAYGELVQAQVLGGLSFSNYPNLEKWMQRMQQLPYHDEAHTALLTLGSLVAPSEVPLAKRLAAATKAFRDTLQQVQSTFDE